MNKKALIEVAKSMGRFLWFGFLGLLATALTVAASDGAILEMSATILGQEISVGAIIVAVIALVVKAIDRYVHANKNLDLNGIAPNILQK